MGQRSRPLGLLTVWQLWVLRFWATAFSGPTSKVVNWHPRIFFALEDLLPEWDRVGSFSPLRAVLRMFLWYQGKPQGYKGLTQARHCSKGSAYINSLIPHHNSM